MEHLKLFTVVLLITTSGHASGYDIIEAVVEDEHHHHHHRPPTHHHHVQQVIRHHVDRVHHVDRHHHSRNSQPQLVPHFPHFQCKENGFFRHPSDCNVFFKCVDITGHHNAFQLFQFNCPHGTQYDDKHHRCLPHVDGCAQPDHPQIETRFQPIPSNRNDPPVLAKPIPGSVIVPDAGSAILPVPSVPTSVANNLCTQPGLFRSPKDCSWFHVCVDVYGNGSMWQLCEYPCPVGTVFSEQKMICTEPQNAEPCHGIVALTTQQPTEPPRPVTLPSTLPPRPPQTLPPQTLPPRPPVTPSPLPPRPQPTLSPPLPPQPEGFICPSVGYFRHESNCTRYFQCVNLTTDHTAFQRFEFACGVGTVFDMSFNICNHPQAVPGCGGALPTSPKPATIPPKPVTYPPTQKPTRPPIPPPVPIGIAPYPDLRCTVGDSAPHPANCSRFYHCIIPANFRPDVPTMWFEFECAAPNVFDIHSGSCNHFDLVPRCWQPQPTLPPLPVTHKPIIPVVTSPPKPVTYPPPAPVTSKPIVPGPRPPIPPPKPIVPAEYFPNLLCNLEGYLPHPHNCSRFFRCIDAAHIRPNEPIKFEFECALGTVFDTVLNNCNYLDQVPRCWQTQPPQPATLPPRPVTYPPQPATLPPRPFTYPPQPATLPPRPVTYPPQPATLPPKPVTYPPQPATRPPIPPPAPIVPAEYIPNLICNKDNYLPHPTNCSRFFRCIDPTQIRPNEPIRYEFECALGTVFDTVLNNCNYLDQVPRCWQPAPPGEVTIRPIPYPTTVPTGSVEGSTTVIVVTLRPPIKPSTEIPPGPIGPIIPPVGPPTGPPCYRPGFFRYPNDCSRFYRCFNLTSDWTKFGKVEFNCGTGTVFDESISVCNHPQLVPGCEFFIPLPPRPTPGPVEPPTYPPIKPVQPSTYPPIRPVEPSTYPPTKPVQPSTYPPIRPVEPSTLRPQPPTYPPTPSSPRPLTGRPTQPIQPVTPTYRPVTPSIPRPGPPCSFNGFMRHTSNCSLFYRCVNTSEAGDSFVRYDFVCGPGSVFDLSISVCNHPQHVPECGGERPVEPPIRPIEPPIRPVEPPIRPVEPPIRPVEPPIKPVEPPIRPVEPPIRPVEPPIRPVEPPIRPVEPPIRPVEPPVQPTTPPSGSQIGSTTQKIVTLPPPVAPPTGVIVVIIPSPPSGESSFVCNKDGFYRHPTDCARFFRCVYNQQTGYFSRLEFACASGSVYDAKINVCNLISQVPECYGYVPTTPPCLPLETEKPTEKPTTLIYTTLPVTTPKIVTQPPVIPTRPPVIPTRPPVVPTRPPVIPTRPPVIPTRPPVIPTQRPPLPITPPCYQEGFFRHPTNCSEFFRCVDLTGNGTHFQKIHFPCSPGTAFDESIQACNFPHLVQGCEGHIIVIPPAPTIVPPVGPSTQPPIIVEWSTAQPTTPQPEITSPLTPLIIEWSTTRQTTIPEVTRGYTTPIVVEWSTARPTTLAPEVTLGPSTQRPVQPETSTIPHTTPEATTTYRPLVTQPSTEQPPISTLGASSSTEAPTTVPTAPSEVSTESSTVKLTTITEPPEEPTTISPVVTPDHVCVAGGKFSHESDCGKFYLCQDLFGDGFQFHMCIVECPAGTFFDPRSGFCSQWVSSSACLAPIPNLPNPNWAYHHYAQLYPVQPQLPPQRPVALLPPQRPVAILPPQKKPQVHIPPQKPNVRLPAHRPVAHLPPQITPQHKPKVQNETPSNGYY